MGAGRAQPSCLSPLLVSLDSGSVLQKMCSGPCYRGALNLEVHLTPEPCSLKIGLAAVNQKEIHSSLLYQTHWIDNITEKWKNRGSIQPCFSSYVPIPVKWDSETSSLLNS